MVGRQWDLVIIINLPKDKKKEAKKSTKTNHTEAGVNNKPIPASVLPTKSQMVGMMKIGE